MRLPLGFVCSAINGVHIHSSVVNDGRILPRPFFSVFFTRLQLTACMFQTNRSEALDAPATTATRKCHRACRGFLR